jgi:uncharacterized protein (DUF305 family)
MKTALRGTLASALLVLAATTGLGTPAAAQSAAAPAHPAYLPADVEFMTGMIGHHAQAILIAGWAPTHGASQPILLLTERIVSGQQDEIDLMKRWLSDFGQPVPEGKAHYMSGMDMSDMGHASMPGMLSQAQLEQLDAARGPEFDRLFLTFMIQHHEGAIVMVNRLFGQGAGEEERSFRFASDVYADQTTEIDRMQKMLAALPPAGSSK